MIPENRFADLPRPDDFLNPWSGQSLISLFWGPVDVADPSDGILVKVWQARAEINKVYVSAPGVPEFIFYTHTHTLTRISLAFNQNGLLHLAFSDTQPLTFLWWFNSLVSGMVLTQMTPDVSSPCLTLDDARPFNIQDSDIIFAYIRAGAVMYRIQRERFDIEYVPPIGIAGPPLSATDLYHISMQNNLVLGFLTDNLPDTFSEPSDLMKKAIIQQKAPVEIIDVVFDFTTLMLFGDTIAAARSVMSVETGTDLNPENMILAIPTFDARTTTQEVAGGLTGNVYRLAVTVRTTGGSIYVIEGLIYVNDSLAEVPAP